MNGQTRLHPLNCFTLGWNGCHTWGHVFLSIQASVLHVTMIRSYRIWRHIDIFQCHSFSKHLLGLSRREHMQTSVCPELERRCPVLLVIRKYSRGLFLDNWKCIDLQGTGLFFPVSRKRDLLLYVRIQCWKMACKPIKDARPFDHLFRAALRLASYTLSFSSVYHIRKLDMETYLALISLLSFLLNGSSLMFLIVLHILFSDAACSFWNGLCMNFWICNHVTWGNMLGLWKNSLPLASISRTRF